MKEKYLKRLYGNESLKLLSLKLAGELSGDLIQEVGLVICEKSDSELEVLDEWFDFWCVRTMINMTTNGKFKKKYREQYLNFDELLVSFDYEETTGYFIDKLEVAIEETYPKSKDGESGNMYKRELFKLYLDLGSTRKVEKEVGIDHCSVAATIRQVKEELKDKL